MLTKPTHIFTIFNALSDPRQQAKVEHQLDEMIFMAVVSKNSDDYQFVIDQRLESVQRVRSRTRSRESDKGTIGLVF